MIDILKKTALNASFLLVVLTLVFAVTAGSLMGSEGGEDTPSGIQTYDYVIKGMMEGFSESSIYVDAMGYRLCDSATILNPLNGIIPLSDLEGAEEVEISQLRGCIKKIKVLHFAE